MRMLEISQARFKVVHREISEGSEPALRFYILVAVSTLIASFGLIANSTAVVIGAMLVAPLMTPIFGISLALVRGEPYLLGRAAQAEIIGVVAAVSMGFILGSMLGEIEPTTEMLSRTHPNLFDLFVAILAGFAGAYALVEEKISPALPGVAIATAIVPPLANSGLCFSLGEVQGGIGSFLLFFANFLSILIVASITFVLSGMAKHYGARATNIDYVRRFGLPFVAFVLIAVFLGHSLIQIYQERHLTKTIKTVLLDNLSIIPATYLGEIRHYSESGKVQVIASVHTPAILTPTQVTGIQDHLSAQIGMPAELVIHCILSNNVSAEGAVNNVITPRLDGTFVRTRTNDTLNDVATAEQIIREHLSDDRALMLLRVESLPLADHRVMLANVLGIRQLSPEEVRSLEARIRNATGDDAIELVISRIEKTLYNVNGAIRYGWIVGEQATPEVRERLRQIRSDLTETFDKEDAFTLVHVNATHLDNTFYFLLEIVGPTLYPRQHVEALQARLNDRHGVPIVLYAWSRIEVVHGPEGMVSLDRLNQSFSTRQKENLPKAIPLVVEATSR